MEKLLENVKLPGSLGQQSRFFCFSQKEHQKSDSNEKTSDLRLRPHKKFQNSVTILQHRPGAFFHRPKKLLELPPVVVDLTNPLMQQNWQNFTAKFLCVDYVTGFMKINKTNKQRIFETFEKTSFRF